MTDPEADPMTSDVKRPPVGPWKQRYGQYTRTFVRCRELCASRVTEAGDSSGWFWYAWDSKPLMAPFASGHAVGVEDAKMQADAALLAAGYVLRRRARARGGVVPHPGANDSAHFQINGGPLGRME
jgi:hypothetical protein